VRKESKDSQQTGDLVKEYIEENKRILKDEKITRIEYNE
jgi:2,3-bisphosphoglycerate-independent phosphoglycerate mutase